MTEPHPEPRDRRSRTWSVTGGRVHDLDDGTDIRIDTHVTTRPGGGAPPPGSSYARVLALCQSTLAVAELAGALVATLRDNGLVDVRAPLDMSRDTLITHALLERVKNGLLHAI
jgi:uncharacterized protein DUF742